LAKEPRIFISHRAADKPYARRIADYFENIGLHYYFDERDEVLQAAVATGGSGAAAIVAAIDHGLAHSTHLLAVLSRRTMGSWWVPFEIGSARGTGKDLRHLLLPSIAAEMVPEYLQVYPQLWSAADLFAWISRLTPWRGYLVNQQYGEYRSYLFGELDPDEETVEHWYYKADNQNHQWLQELDAVFQGDSDAPAASPREATTESINCTSVDGDE
jgi:hypothetical protein